MTEATNPAVPEVAADGAEDFTAFEAKVAAPEPDKQPEADPDTFEDDADTPEEVLESDDDDEDEWEEIEWKGKQIKVPKGAALMQSDYTRKTQELAEQRKEVEATLERVTSASQEETQALARVAYIDAQLSQFEDIDWNAWDMQNPIEANRARWQLTELRNAREGAVGHYQQAQNNARSIAQQETAKRVEEGQKVLAERIPGWGQEKAVTLLNEGKKAYGFTDDELREIDDPRLILALNDAIEHRNAQAKAKQRAKVEQAQAVKPVPTLKGNSGATRPRADTNDFKAFEKIAAKVLASR